MDITQAMEQLFHGHKLVAFMDGSDTTATLIREISNSEGHILGIIADDGRVFNWNFVAGVVPLAEEE